MRLLARAIDTRPLRISTFRKLWMGTSLQAIGRQITVVAVLYQVWEMTHDSLWVGVIGLSYSIPTVVLGLIGGTLADAVDRRRLVLWTTLGALIVSTFLAIQALFSFNSLALLYALLLIQAAFTSLGGPARRTFVSRILPKDQVGAGVALSHLSFQISMLVVPALAGLIIAGWGLTACFVVEALAFGAALYEIAGLPAIKPLAQTGRAGIQAFGDGIRFIARKPALLGSFLSDLSATLLAMPIALFPAMNEERFDGSPETLGLFLSAIAVGGICASTASGAITGSLRPGRVQLLAAAMWGASLAMAGISISLWSTLTFLAIAGAADTVAVISRGTLLQLATPDAYRGRVSSVEQIVGVGAPQLGNFRAGLMGSFSSPATTLAAGGVLCVLSIGAIALKNTHLRNFTLSDNTGKDE